MDERIEKLISTLSKNHVGALKVCVDLFQTYGEHPLQVLDQWGITGREIWVLYKDGCEEDYEAMYISLMNGTAMDKLRSNPNSQFSQASSHP